MGSQLNAFGCEGVLPALPAIHEALSVDKSMSIPCLGSCCVRQPEASDGQSAGRLDDASEGAAIIGSGVVNQWH
jgi:hypothetical protein